MILKSQKVVLFNSYFDIEKYTPKSFPSQAIHFFSWTFFLTITVISIFFMKNTEAFYILAYITKKASPTKKYTF